MDKILTIDGKEVGFRATALTPRLYRHRMQRDIVQDLNRLCRNYDKAQRGVPDPVYPANATKAQRAAIDQEHDQAVQDAQLDVLDLEIFENAAYIMAKQYNPDLPDTPEAWLDGFESFSIYMILSPILELWGMTNATTAKPKKK